MSRRRRRRGPGSARGANRGGSKRRIIITSVAPTGQIKSSRPTIQAYVEDRYGSLLSRHDIDVYLDGEPQRVSFGRSSGRLTCPPTKSLSSGTHTVEIEANTDDGVGRKRWTFNVKK